MLIIMPWYVAADLVRVSLPSMATSLWELALPPIILGIPRWLYLLKSYPCHQMNKNLGAREIVTQAGKKKIGRSGR